MMRTQGKNPRLERALQTVMQPTPFREFNAITAELAGDSYRCLAELGRIMEDINTVITMVPIDDFKKGGLRANLGKQLVLTGEERELLDNTLTKTLKNFIAHAEVLETMQASVIDRGGDGDSVQSYDRFRMMAIEQRADHIIQRFSIAINGLATFTRKDPNPYLLAFNKHETKKYTAAEELLKEHYVFYKLILGDLKKYKAEIMRVESPYAGKGGLGDSASATGKADKVREKEAREQRNKEVEGARAAYQAAFTFARSQLKNTHPYALRIGLSFSTMYYDFLDMPERAIELATQIHREVAPRVIEANKDQEASVRNAALPVLQELEERLFLWTVVQPMDSQDPTCYAQADLEDML